MVCGLLRKQFTNRCHLDRLQDKRQIIHFFASFAIFCSKYVSASGYQAHRTDSRAYVEHWVRG